MFPTLTRARPLALAALALLALPAGRADADDEADRRLAERLQQIRLLKAELKDSRFDFARADRAYAEAFRAHDIDVDKLGPEKAAERVRASGLRNQLVAALDDWAFCTGDRPRRAALLEVARRADPDPWRNRLRDAVGKNDRKALQALAADDAMPAQPAATLVLLAGRLGEAGDPAGAVAVLRQAQRRHPGDFWVNHELASWLLRLPPPRWDEAVRFYSAALALRPDNPAVQNNLGTALRGAGKVDEAVAAYRRAIQLKPDFADVHANLGAALMQLGKADEAVAACRQAIALKPDFAPAHANLGHILRAQGKIAEAVAEFRRAIELQPGQPGGYVALATTLVATGKLADAEALLRKAIALEPRLADAHYGLGNLLMMQGKLDEAVAAFRRCLELNPNAAEAHVNLGGALRRQGKFAESLAAYRRGHQLGAGNPRWPYPSAQWVQEGELLVKLDARLPAVLRGDERPTPAERVQLAQMCVRYKNLPAAAAKLFADAFAADEKLADDLKAGNRHAAAVAAAQAGAGRGDGAKLDEDERAVHRKQALDWLHADLKAREKQIDGADRRQRAEARQALRAWRREPALAATRDPAALAKVAAAEREAWHKFWGEVEAALDKAAKADSD
jgi:eukaryotic-like serine/threonine-protein kinase